MRRGTVALATLTLALAACSGNKSTGGASPQPSGAASGTTIVPNVAATPDCHGESPVWVLPRIKVYLEPGERHYGKTKRGEYLCLKEAEDQGYRPARNPAGQPHRRHHPNPFS
ncbi:MAG: hypothetical protein JO113_00190 [Candidatus Eremiobacteraeota bacterium]|nr:hypothetical protein [Candidatus Eremiobacteraeota bacterium]